MTAAPRYQPLSVRRVWAIHGAVALVVAATAAAAVFAHVPGLFAVPGAMIGVEVGVWIWLSRRAGRMVQRMGDNAILVEQGEYARAAPQLDAARAATAETLALAPYWPELAAFVAGSRLEAAL